MKSKKTKILILSGIFHPDIGGPATQLRYLIKDLQDLNFEIEVLTFGRKDKKENYSYRMSKVSRSIPQPIRYILYFLITIIKARNFDILYSQDLYMSGISALLAKKLWRKNLVTRFVGDSAWEYATSHKFTEDNLLLFQEKKYSRGVELRKKIRKAILTNSEKVVVVSNFLKNVALKIGVREEKIKVIYNSADFLDEEIKELGEKSESKEVLGLFGTIILSAGRLVPWKGMQILIEAVAEIKKEHPEVRLIILGDGPEYQNLKKEIVRLKAENFMTLAGGISRTKMLIYLNVADIFVLNSNYEGMSHVILEAMKVGLPVITTNVGGNPETIKDGYSGLLIKFNNKEDVKKAILKLIENKELRKELAQNAIKESINFNWQTLVDQTVQIFKNLKQ